MKWHLGIKISQSSQVISMCSPITKPLLSWHFLKHQTSILELEKTVDFFFSSLFSAMVHRTLVFCSKRGTEGILEHNHGLETYMLLPSAYWEVLAQRVASYPVCHHHGSGSKGARTSNCSGWPLVGSHRSSSLQIIRASSAGTSLSLGELFSSPTMCMYASYMDCTA